MKYWIPFIGLFDRWKSVGNETLMDRHPALEAVFMFYQVMSVVLILLPIVLGILFAYLWIIVIIIKAVQ